MVVDVVDIERVAFGKAENDPPVGTDGDGPKTLKRTLKGMKSKAGEVHIRDAGRSVETNENIAQPLGMLA